MKKKSAPSGGQRSAVSHQRSARENALLLDALAHDSTYGCYSRQGLELVMWPQIRRKARYVVFADIDGMHELNEAHGYDEVDRRIRNALKVRSSDLAATGRWYSGDEIVWIISEGDPYGLAKRLVKSLEKQGLTATFSVAAVVSEKLSVNVNKAAVKVQAAKKNGQRGSVLE